MIRERFVRFMLARRGAFLWKVFAEHRWFRRMIGGQWECWYLDVVHACEWFHRLPDDPHERPLSTCRGVPNVETYAEPRG